MGAPRALLVDIDGVLVVSWEPLPGALDAMVAVRAAGLPVRFLTNTTSRTQAEIGEALQNAGFEVTADEVITAAAATTSYLHSRHPGARCLLLNSGDITDDLGDLHLVADDAPADEVDVVILGGAGPEFSYDALNRVVQCLLSGATFVAMHRNVVWRTRDGLQLDTGAFVAGLERAAGVEATVVGKPAAAMFEAGLRAMGVDATEAAMIGDDLDSDVRGAQAIGITGVQVRTGKFREEQLREGERPDVLLDSIADVPGWLDVG